MALILVGTAYGSGASGNISKIKALVQNGTVVCNDEKGNTLVRINPDKQFIPASIIKVLTSQIALDILKEDFSFKTECYFDSLKQLTIKGYGDPYLVSDEIRMLADTIKKTINSEIASLMYDNSFFSEELSIPGVTKTNNPYDALNGALVVNFNTVNVGKDSTGALFSAEEETPLTPLAREKAKMIQAGSKERINLSSNSEDCERYAGELLLTILREKGITITDTTTIRKETIGKDCKPVVVYKNSRKLPEVLKGLLKYSNNFIANQIFLLIGAHKAGAPASMAKGKTVFESYIRNTLEIPESELMMVEGSGISRQNRVSGKIMLEIMEKFKPYANLLTPKHGHPVKSGTLHHVSNYAGYIKTEKGLRSFVIMLNQKDNNRDTILKLLAKL